VIDRPVAAGSSQVSVELAPGDPWPENDALRANVPLPEEFERWWVGGSGPGGSWRTIDPHQLPTDSNEYLAAGIIVLDNIAASELSEPQQQRLQQYVRDLGGGLLILGGDHAFAAGGYQGTLLEAMSPLASNPPLPTMHWVLLADGSGSMSEAVPGGTRWQYVTGAIAGALPLLPPDDVVSVGSFAESLQWWIEGKPAREAAATPLPPNGAFPHGPTNLQPALESIARSVDGKMPVQLLVLSDFDTQITGVADLAGLLNSKQMHLHLLAVGEGTALPALRQVAAATGGSVLTELDPARWSAAARELAHASGSKLLGHEPARVTFTDPAMQSSAQSTEVWNRVWLKPASSPLAEARVGGETIPMAAEWNAGEGRVLAAAFSPRAPAIEQLVARVARPPRDPRFHVTWETGSLLRVIVDAIDGQRYLNGEDLKLELGGQTRAVPQVGPGKYELAIESPRSSIVASLRASGRVVDRIALASRYAPEFDAVGNDLLAMRELARRSGGAVIPPSQGKPIEIRWPARTLSLVPELATAGALFIALGLIAWRKSAS
jgi:Ca-activated chloride channel family protein